MAHHHHTHGHFQKESDGNNLLAVTVLNLIITVAEVVGGLVSNSLALLSDALHNMSDTFAVLIAFVANRVGRKGSTPKKTFGYKRVEILAALFNAVVLVVITVFIFVEAIKRIEHPEPIKGVIMFIVATIGLIANLAAVVMLRKDKARNINIRAAYLHLFGDTVSSVAVIAGSVFIIFFDVTWLDPVLTFIIGIYILKETFEILKESVDILMQSAPKDIDLKEIKNALEGIKEIDNIHHVHIWNLNDQQVHFECHIELKEDLKLSATEELRMRVEKILIDKFNVSHVTIQLEYNCCSDDSLIHTPCK